MSNHNILTFARRYPLVWRLWLSRVFTANADGIGQFAIQWLATTFPNPAIALAYANTFGRIGMVLSSYLVGWLSDSIPPIILMVSGNLFGALFTIGMGLLLNRVHSLLLLLGLVMLWNSFTIITRAASRSIVPRTVDRTDLPSVNAWMGAIQPIQQFLAKGFAGIMIATGLFHAFLAAGIVMLVSTVPLVTKHSWPKPVRRTTTSIHILSGMRVVWSMRRLRQMVVYTSVQNFGFSFFLAEYILYLKATERLSAAQIGVALSIATLGAVLSLMLGPRLLQNRLQWVVVSSPLLIAAGIAIISAGGGLPGLIGGLLFLEFGSGFSNQTSALIRQRTVPIDMMGSASGALDMFHSFLVPLGMALAGLVAVRFGTGVTLTVSWVVVLLSTCFAWILAKSTKFELQDGQSTSSSA